MAKFTALLLAAVALVAVAQAQRRCPANGHFCGSELVDVYKCKSGLSLREDTKFRTWCSDSHSIPAPRRVADMVDLAGTNATYLRSITPPFDEWTTDIYSTTDSGEPQIPSTSCKALDGCRNSDLTLTPPRYATCFKQ